MPDELNMINYGVKHKKKNLIPVLTFILFNIYCQKVRESASIRIIQNPSNR